MIITKYNFYASCNKIIEEYFKKILGHTNNSPARVFRTSLSSDDIINDTIVNNTYHEYIDKTLLQKMENTFRVKNDTVMFFDRIEDKISLTPNSIINLINNVDTCEHDIIILLPLTDFKKKLFSVVCRAFDEKIFKLNKETPIDTLINFRVRSHVDCFDPWNSRYDIFNYIDFNYMFLFSYIEELIYLHNNKQIKLIPMSENTILNEPQKIFSSIGIPCGEDIAQLKGETIAKDVTPMRISVYNKILHDKKDQVFSRMNHINHLFEINNIQIL